MIADEDLVFYVTHYCADASDEILIQRCIQSIQTFYPTSDIILCRSPSSYSSTIYDTFHGITLIENPLPNSFTCGSIKDYLERYKDSKKKIISIHDSVFLKGRFVEERLERKFGFLWWFPYFLCAPQFLCNTQMRFHYMDQMTSEPKMHYRAFSGCFGCCIFGDYESIDFFWNSAPIEEYLEIGDKKNVLQDLERMFGLLAFKHGLVTTEDDCSLCGEIYKMPHAFQQWFSNQSFEEILAIPYNEACVKVWKKRFMKS
jgi:hypothetical protein